MKKIVKARKTSVRTQAVPAQEPWRQWVIMLLALGFALLVITLLSKQNNMLLAEVQALTNENRTLQLP